MNLHKSLTLTACIAAVVLLAVSGCSRSNSSSSPQPVPPPAATSSTPPSTPTPTTAPPTLGTPRAGYDEWKTWSSGETDPEIVAATKLMGLTDATYPNQELFSQGFVGVAKLSSGCIVTFSTLGVHHKGSLSAAILSRFSPTGLTVAQVDSTLAQLTAFVAAYRQVCTLTSSTSSGTAV